MAEAALGTNGTLNDARWAVVARQPIGTFNGHSIEIGFGSGHGDLALANPVYHPDGAATAAGRAMSQLLTSLGAPEQPCLLIRPAPGPGTIQVASGSARRLCESLLIIAGSDRI